MFFSNVANLVNGIIKPSGKLSRWSILATYHKKEKEKTILKPINKSSVLTLTKNCK